jgi:mannonate dehydratase
VSHLDRRQFGAAALSGVFGGPAALLAAEQGAAKRPPDNGRRSSRIKLAAQMSQNPSQEDLLLLKQLGVQYVSVWVRGRQASAAAFRKIVDTYASAGVTVWNIGNLDVHNMEEVTLNLPGRDKKIEQYKSYLRTMHSVGLSYTTYAHMANGIWSSGPELCRGARARALNLARASDRRGGGPAGGQPRGSWVGKTFQGPLTHGRRYSQEEIWDNYTYFIRQVVPVAEELGIRIGIHPDDPPVPELGGVPRCIFSSFEGYRRALEIAGSDNVGLCLCVGCWLEGGKLMGKDALETIRYFGKRRKIFKTHFRNVSAPLPHFVETFLDNGYMDMHQVMNALQEVGFDGIVIPDHVPSMVGGARVQLAYSIGYMRALLQRAEQEA